MPPHLLMLNHLVASITNKLHIPPDGAIHGLIQKSEKIKILFYIQVYIVLSIFYANLNIILIE